MALLFLDSFDGYDSAAHHLRKWSSSRGSSYTQGTGRFSNGWNGGTRWSKKDFAIFGDTMILGAAMDLSASTFPNDDTIWQVYDNGTVQVCLTWNIATRLFQFRRGTRTGTAIGSSFAFVPAFGQFYYIEAKFVVNNTTGSVELRINGSTVISNTGLDTQNTANAFANQFLIGSTQDSFTMPTYDDLYCCDGTGSAPGNDFLGDIRVQYRSPNGNGNSSVLLGSDGNSTDNYLLVDEAPVNDDTDYVGSATPGDKDTYTYQDLSSASGTVYGVQILPTARKDDAGARSIKTIARLSGTEEDGPEKALGTSYELLPDVRETKPGGGAWSISDVNSAEFGVKVFA